MANILRLFIGEVNRLFRYKILLFGLIVSVLWLIVLGLTSAAEAQLLLPQLIVLDTGLMAIILLSSSYFFEKQEGTLKALLVSPISNFQLLTAKVMATFVPGFISITLMTIVMLVVHQIWIPYLMALLFVVLSTTAHVSIGYPLMFLSKDFMDLLVKYTFIALLFLLPSILVPLEVIPNNLTFIAFLSPSYAAQYLVDGLFVTKDLGYILWSMLVLIALPATLFPLFIYPSFKKEAIRA
jgi:fluoroquinolone transport system permease protein